MLFFFKDSVYLFFCKMNNTTDIYRYRKENTISEGRTVMLSLVYSVCCVLLPCILCALVLRRGLHGKEWRFHLVWVIVFLLVISGMFIVTGFGSIWDIGRYD